MMEVGKLSDFCEVIAGQSPKGSSYNEVGIGMEFHQGKKAFGREVIEPSGVWTTEVTKTAEAGDILMSVRAPVGPTNFTNRPVCIGRGLASIRCASKVLPRFILYSLRNIQETIVGKDGAVFNSINKDMIENLPVPVASLSEQRRIVEVLDAEFGRIDALKGNAGRNLQNAKDLFQAAMKKELTPKDGWTLMSVKDVSSEMFAGGDAPKNNMSKESNERYSIPIYANAVENDGLYGYTDIARVTKPSVTIAGRGSGTGYVIERNHPFVPIVRLIVIIPDDAIITNRFLFYSLQFLNIRSNGSAIPQLTVPMIANYSIGVPSVAEQHSIVSRLDSLDSHCRKLQENYGKTAALCDDLKQALLRKAFSGEL